MRVAASGQPVGLASGRRRLAAGWQRSGAAARPPAGLGPRRPRQQAPAAPAGAYPSAPARGGATAADAEPITLPLNFYAALHVNRASSREAVKRAYERVVAAPPDVGYSQDALFSRAVLLKSAAETLADLESRRAYDAAAGASGAHTVAVSRDNLPGACAVLCICRH